MPKHHPLKAASQFFQISRFPSIIGMEINEYDYHLLEDSVKYVEALKALLPSLKHDISREAVTKQIIEFSALNEVFLLMQNLDTCSAQESLPIQPSLIEDISSCGGTI
jgi:hypothetical protein